MRTIKFRAWDKRVNMMFLVREMFWLVGGLQVDDGATTQRGFATKDFEIMQYTGLKDKNGKKIYEGDILKTQGTEPQYDTVSWNDNGYWECMGFKGKIIKELEFEVIGNIYENPELLEAEK